MSLEKLLGVFPMNPVGPIFNFGPDGDPKFRAESSYFQCNGDPVAHSTLIGRPIKLNTKLERHMRNKRGDVKCPRILERFKITHIVRPFEIVPSNAQRIAPMPPITELTESIPPSISGL